MSWQWFLVEGLNPEPWQAALGSVGRRKGGTFVQFHSPEQMRLYQQSLKEMFTQQNPHAVLNAVDNLSVVFYFWRQLTLNEMFEGKNRRTHVADATNLQKATEDALQKILYDNDRQVVDVRSVIIEQDRETEPRILIAVGEYDGYQEAAEVTRIAASLSRPEPEVASNKRQVDTSDLF